MDKRAAVNFEIEKNDRRYVFSMQMGSPLGEAYDAVFEVLNEIVQMSQEAAGKAERKKEEDVVEEPVVEVVKDATE